MASKAKHRHVYVKHLVQSSTNANHFSLVNICSICGKERDVPFKEHLTQRENGTSKWMTTLEDFSRVYGELSIIYRQR